MRCRIRHRQRLDAGVQEEGEEEGAEARGEASARDLQQGGDDVQVIPPSDPPRTGRTRGGKGGAREQFAAAQRALGQEELGCC